MTIAQPSLHTISQTISTADGPFSILAEPAGAVLASGWTDDVNALLARLSPAHQPTRVTTGQVAAADAVAAFYDNELTAIDTVAVKQTGTESQQLGWKTLRTITPGAPLSYTEFAAQLGAPRAVRAAASICARNACALFVPCHRVLRSDGSLGGFAWGVGVKHRLLQREAARH